MIKIILLITLEYPIHRMEQVNIIKELHSLVKFNSVVFIVINLVVVNDYSRHCASLL